MTTEKNEQIVKNLSEAIDKMTAGDFKLIFISPDTKGNPRASVSNIYKQAKILFDLGHKVVMLTEKKDNINASAWLGSEYDTIPHFSIEENLLSIDPQDILVVPEIFGNVLEQIEKLPIEKIFFVQSYEYIFDTFAPGKCFLDYGAEECLTTSQNIANLINDTLKYPNIKVIPIGIEDCFSPSDKPQKPLVAIHCRESRKAAKIIKTFYLKYPIYRFLSFKDMHGMIETDFAANLKECCLSVWIDDESSFGTFPVESIKCNVPVVGKIPNIQAEWMTDDNGIWLYDDNHIVDIIANYIKNWLEDSLPENLLNVSKTLEGKYGMEEFKSITKDIYEYYISNKIAKLEKIKETYLKTETTNG